MRRSVENAEHVGLYLPMRFSPEYWYPEPNPGVLAYRRRRPLRRTGRFDHDRGVYMPPARAMYPDYSVPMGHQDFPTYPSPDHRRIPFLVDTRSPYDPFAGRPSAL